MSILDKLRYPGRNLERERRTKQEADAAAAKYERDVGASVPEEAGIEEGDLDMLVPGEGADVGVAPGSVRGSVPNMRPGGKPDLVREKFWNRAWEAAGSQEARQKLLQEGKEAVIDRMVAAEKAAAAELRKRVPPKSNKQTAESISYGRKSNAFGDRQDMQAAPSVRPRK